ncbi:MAG: hypothetical protein V4805_13115 [Pseudomonadota bacterium]
MNETKLTIEQAYRAMFYFLEREYGYTKADEIGGLLSSLSWEITGGHGPGDQGAWEDWLDAVLKATTTQDDVWVSAKKRL